MLKHLLLSWLKSLDKNVLIQTSFSEIHVPNMQFLDTTWFWVSLDHSTASCFWHYSAIIPLEMISVVSDIEKIK